MQIITVISQACDMARRKFTRGEQSMLIDIFNGTALTPGILGQHLAAQIEDSFRLYPGIYEEKWGVNEKEMIDKIKIISLDPVSAVFLELWAVGFWAVNQDAGDLENYLSGKLTLSTRIEELIGMLDSISERLEQTKNSFKSAAVAEARSEAEKAKEILEGMI